MRVIARKLKEDFSAIPVNPKEIRAKTYLAVKAIHFKKPNQNTHSVIC